MKIGLFFGSFNPIHHGHLVLANHLVEYTDFEQVWFVVSPQNPFKEKQTLLDERTRLHLVNLAIEGDLRFKAVDIEFKLPKPSYTSHTLVHLREKYPQHDFALFMGEDNLRHFHKWKNVETIVEHHEVVYYPRTRSTEIPSSDFLNTVKLTRCEAPEMDISSSYVRKLVSEGKEVRYVVPDRVRDYMDEMNLYR